MDTKKSERKEQIKQSQGKQRENQNENIEKENAKTDRKIRIEIIMKNVRGR